MILLQAYIIRQMLENVVKGLDAIDLGAHISDVYFSIQIQLDKTIELY